MQIEHSGSCQGETACVQKSFASRGSELNSSCDVTVFMCGGLTPSEGKTNYSINLSLGTLAVGVK